MAILEIRVGGEVVMLRQLVKFIGYLRGQNLQKTPGVAETIDWARALITLNTTSLTQESIDSTLGCILKSQKDIDEIRHSITNILEDISA